MLSKLILLCFAVSVHPSCSESEPCPSGQTCVSGYCFTSCTQASDCNSEEICVYGVCGEPDDEECDPACEAPQTCDTSGASPQCVTPTCDPPCVAPATCDTSGASPQCVSPTCNPACVSPKTCDTSVSPPACVDPPTCPVCSHSQYCDTATGQCADCSGSCSQNQYCNAADQKCTTCSSGSGSGCSSTTDPKEICNSAGQCVSDPCNGTCKPDEACETTGKYCFIPKCGPGCERAFCTPIVFTCFCLVDTDCKIAGQTCNQDTFVCEAAAAPPANDSAAHMYAPVVIAVLLLVFML